MLKLFKKKIKSKKPKQRDAFLCCGNCDQYGSYWVGTGEAPVPESAYCGEWILRMCLDRLTKGQYCDYFRKARRFDGTNYNWTRNPIVSQG